MSRVFAALLVMAMALLGFVVPASAATGTIQVTVSGLTAGAPPVDAWVFVYSGEPQTDVFTDPCDDENCVQAQQTNGSGVATVSGLAIGTYKVFIQSNSPSYYSRWYGGKGDTYAAATGVAAPNGGQTSISTQLTVKGGITGNVADDTGVKQGVTVTAYQVNGDGTQNPSGKNTTTDASGNYRIPSLAPGSYRVFASDLAHVGRWNGGATSFAAAPNIVVADGADATGVNFSLPRYGSISGTVTDSASAAVSGATVEAHTVSGSTDGGVARTATTTADGTYTLGTLAPGSYRVRVLPTGTANGPAWNGNATSFAGAPNLTITSGASLKGTNISLPASPGGISGTVSPFLAGTTVTALTYGGDLSTYSTTVDASGAFALSVPAGSYRLRVDPPAARPDYGTAWVYQRCSFGACSWVSLPQSEGAISEYDRVTVSAGAVTSGVTATLSKIPVLAGRITDTNGAPVANASVELWLRTMISDGFGTSYRLSGDDVCVYHDGQGPMNPCMTVTTDADGRYLVHPPTPWPGGFGDAKDYLLRVVPSDGLHRIRWVGATADSELPSDWPMNDDFDRSEWSTVPGYGESPDLLNLNQVLSGAGRVSGTVTSSTGGPAAGLAVRVHSNLDDGSALAGRNYRTTTASDGTWSIGRLPAGGYSIYFAEESDEYVPTAYQAGQGLSLAAYQSRTGVDGVVQPGGLVSGTITGDDGDGPAGLPGATVHVFPPSGAELTSVTTGSDGTYSLRLVEGTYRLYVTPPPGATFTPRWYGTGATSQATAADVAVTAGSATDADVQLDFVPPPPTPTTFTAKAAAATIVAGRSTTVSGVLTDDDALPVPGVGVTLQARKATARSYSTVAEATTSAKGSVSTTVKPTVGTSYRWVFAGDTTYAAATSPAVTVKVAFGVSAKAVKTRLSHRSRATIFGTVNPATEGRKVVLQQLVKGRWKTLSVSASTRKQKLPGARSATVGYVLSFTRPRGTYSFRIVAPASSTNTTGTSGPVRITFT